MRLQKSIALPALVMLVLYPSVARAGPCDTIQFTINPQLDRRKLLDCIKELKSEFWILGMKVQNLETENHVLRGHLCLIASELKRLGSSSELTALVIEDARADLRAAAKKRSTGPAKSKE
jgi:hypothetical protein